MKKSSLGSLYLFAAIVMTVGCGVFGAGWSAVAADSAAAKTYKKASIRLTNNGTETAADSLLAFMIAEKVAAETGGNVVVEVFTNDQLAGGNQSKGIEMLSQGIADIGIYSNSTTGGVLDERLLAASIPFAFTDYRNAAEFYDSTGGPFIDKVLGAKRLSYLGSIHNGLRQFSNSKRPILAPADMKNLKIRVMGSEIYLDIFRTLGADPIAMSWSEVYTALQQGTIDGQDNGFMTSASTKMFEVQKYFTRINYTYDAFLVMANKVAYDKLPEETREMLQRIITESCLEIRQKVVDNEESLIKQFREEYGVEITELSPEQVAVFKNVLQPVIDKYKAQYGPEACAAFGMK